MQTSRDPTFGPRPSSVNLGTSTRDRLWSASCKPTEVRVVAKWIAFVDPSVESVHCSKEGRLKRTDIPANGRSYGDQTVVGSEVTCPNGGWTTRGLCGRDAKFRPTYSGELFARPERWLPYLHLIWQAQGNWKCAKRDKFYILIASCGVKRSWRGLMPVLADFVRCWSGRRTDI